MAALVQIRDRRRFRLAGNDNETIVDDELDVEGHRLAGNDNEIVVEGDEEPAQEAEEPAGLRRQARR